MLKALINLCVFPFSSDNCSIAFFLFLTPALALIGSLIAHNILVSFKYGHGLNYSFENNLPQTTTSKFECNEQNEFCEKPIFKKAKKLNKCSKFLVEQLYVAETGKILDINDSKDLNIKKLSEGSNQKIFVQWKISDKLNEFSKFFEM